MPLGTVAHTHLPYCLQKTKDGKWLALNRNYKPLGVVSKKEWFDYDAHPDRLPIHPKTLEAIKRKAVNVIEDREDDPGIIYFYKDGSMPTTGAADWKRYCEMLSLWANAKVK